MMRQDSAYSEDQTTRGIISLACGSDFILALNADQNIYGIGQNKSG